VAKNTGLSCSPQASRKRHRRTSECAGSASSRGARRSETVISGKETGSRKTVHSGAQASGVPFGNAGDQVGGPGQRQRGRKAATIVTISRSSRRRFNASSIGSLVETPPRDRMCLPAA